MKKNKFKKKRVEEPLTKAEMIGLVIQAIIALASIITAISVLRG